MHQRRLKDSLVDYYYRVGQTSVGQRMVRPFRGKVGILMYHRVLPAQELLSPNPNNDIAISEELFENQIQYLAKHYQVIPMGQVVSHLSDSSSNFSVVITFDDGYRDNLTQALPILKKYHVPATIYVVTRFPEGDHTMWWYELWELCESQTILEFSWKTRKLTWNLHSLEEKQRCFQDLRTLILSQAPEPQVELLKQIRGGEPAKRYEQDCVSWDDIRQLSQEPLITIGAHTLTHPNLTQLKKEDAGQEIIESKQLLESHLGSVKHFAYPFGSPNEVSAQEVELAQQCGFETAVTSQCFPMNKANQWHLPRYAISERHTPEKLSVVLSGWNALLKRQM
ncbi:polysaccharide deacetylase family protein [Deltaproteobacteria bacterium TL4]